MSAFFKFRRFVWVACLLGITLPVGSVAAQQGPKKDPKPSASNQGGGWKGHGPHAGTWLRRFQDVPAADQEKALNNDPDFQKLPAEEQDKLRRRLREFNSYSPQKRQRILKRMELFEHLSPEQQARARELYGRLRTLPDDRRKVVRRTARNLRQFDAAERERVLDSPEYRNSFNENELALIRELSALDLGSAAAEHRSEIPKPE